MTVRRAALAMGALAAFGVLGCGASQPEPAPRESTPRSQREVQVDSALRAVVLAAPADLRRTVRFVDPDAVTRAPFDRSKTAMVVVGSSYLPWDEDGDGVSQTRSVALDRAVLVGRDSGPRNLRALKAGSMIAVYRAPSQTQDLLSGSLTNVVGQNDTQGVPDRLATKEFKTAKQALDAVRTGDVAAASVTRSSFIQNGRGLQRIKTDVSYFANLAFFVGTLRPTKESRALRRWLLSSRGTKALRAAGFRAPPSQDPDLLL